MTEAQVARMVRLELAQVLAVSIDRLIDGADYRRDLGADSLDLVEIPAALEKRFGVLFTDEQVAFCKTVGTTIDLVTAKLENRGLVE